MSDRSALQRLRTAMEGAETALNQYREERTAKLREYVGFNFNKTGGTDERVPINFLEMAVQTYLRQLAARAPRAKVSTPHRDLKAPAFALQMALNVLIEQIDLQTTMRSAVLDAMFSPLSVIKVGIREHHAEVQDDGSTVMIGQPYADTVSIDDFLCDTTARRLDRMQFAADASLHPLDWLRQSSLYDQSVVARLHPTTREHAGTHGAERADTIAAGDYSPGDDADIVDHVRLWDIWLPLDRKVITIAHDQWEAGVLREVQWQGPEAGPYRYLRFNYIPDTIFGLPPVALWYDLHDIANRVMVKIGDQAERQKTITGYAAGAEKDAEAIRDAADGELVHLAHPEMIKQIVFPGPDQQSVLLSTQLRGLFSWAVGNLDSIAGLGPQSGTATQDQMIAAASSQRLNDMRDQVFAFAQDVMRDLAIWLWSHPFIRVPYTKTLPGTEVSEAAEFNEDSRVGDFLSYNLAIEPFSMTHQSPSEKLGTIINVWNTFVLPAIPLMEPMGLAPNIPGLLRQVGELTGVDMDELVMFSEPSIQQQMGPITPQQGSPDRMPKSPVTRREEIRRSVPGTSRQNQDAILSQMVASGGGGVQGSQAQAAGVY